MELGLTGRVAIIAAASKGLGRAVTENWPAKALTWPFVHARRAPSKRRPRTFAKARAAKGSLKALDVTDSVAVAAFAAAVEARFGRVDICVTNSGGPPSNSFKSTKPEVWRSAVD